MSFRYLFILAPTLAATALINQNCAPAGSRSGSRELLRAGSSDLTSNSNIQVQSEQGDGNPDGATNMPISPPENPCPDGPLTLTVSTGQFVEKLNNNHWRCSGHLDMPGCEITVTSNMVPDEIILDAEYGESTGYGPNGGGRWSAYLSAGPTESPLALADFRRSSVDWNNSALTILGKAHTLANQLSRDRKNVQFTLARKAAGLDVGYKVADTITYVDKIESGAPPSNADHLKILRLSFGSNDSRNAEHYAKMPADLMIKRLQFRAGGCIGKIEGSL